MGIKCKEGLVLEIDKVNKLVQVRLRLGFCVVMYSKRREVVCAFTLGLYN